MRVIDLIVIHCAATPNGDSLFRGAGTALVTPVQAIDAMHRQRGFHRKPEFRADFNPGLSSIGYHFVIYTNGAHVSGRGMDEIGAHVQGFNAKSIGICLIGTDHFTAPQWAALREQVSVLQKRFTSARIVGHRDLSPDLNYDGVIERNEWLKTCPGFDVAAWLKGGMQPLADHLFTEPK